MYAAWTSESVWTWWRKETPTGKCTPTDKPVTSHCTEMYRLTLYVRKSALKNACSLFKPTKFAVWIHECAPYRHSMSSPQILSAAANILNKQTLTSNEGWSSSLNIANNPHCKKTVFNKSVSDSSGTIRQARNVAHMEDICRVLVRRISYTIWGPRRIYVRAD